MKKGDSPHGWVRTQNNVFLPVSKLSTNILVRVEAHEWVMVIEIMYVNLLTVREIRGNV